MHLGTPQSVVDAYIDAVGARDVPRCLKFYADNAMLDAGPIKRRGKKELEEWHQARFAANLQIVRIDDVFTDGDTVTVEGAITSNRLKLWRIGTIAGRAIFHVQDGKITELHFALPAHALEGFHW